MRLHKRLNGSEFEKYAPESDDEVDANSVRKLIEDALNNKMKPFILSEPLPVDWDKGPVKVLVGDNFEQVAYGANKHVFVKFYAPWCGQ